MATPSNSKNHAVSSTTEMKEFLADLEMKFPGIVRGEDELLLQEEYRAVRVKWPEGGTLEENRLILLDLYDAHMLKLLKGMVKMRGKVLNEDVKEECRKLLTSIDNTMCRGLVKVNANRVAEMVAEDSR